MKILDRLPFEACDSFIPTHVGPLHIRPYQIMVWVSLRTKDNLSRPFPAVLDTGLNHNLAINESLLHSWLDLTPARFDHWGFAKIEGEKIPVKMADALLHPNIRGEKTMSGKAPFPLETPQGILIFPKTNVYPRLPILGLRALINSGLQTVISGKGKFVSVSSGWC